MSNIIAESAIYQYFHKLTSEAKIFVVGPEKSGKTTLIQQFILTNEINKKEKKEKKTVSIFNRNWEIQFQQSNGKQNKIVKKYLCDQYKKCSLVLAVFDVTDQNSLEKLQQLLEYHSLKRKQKNKQKGSCITLVANKVGQKERRIQTGLALQFARKYQMFYFQYSKEQNPINYVQIYPDLQCIFGIMLLKLGIFESITQRRFVEALRKVQRTSQSGLNQSIRNAYQAINNKLAYILNLINTSKRNVKIIRESIEYFEEFESLKEAMQQTKTKLMVYQMLKQKCEYERRQESIMNQRRLIDQSQIQEALIFYKEKIRKIMKSMKNKSDPIQGQLETIQYSLIQGNEDIEIAKEIIIQDTIKNRPIRYRINQSLQILTLAIKNLKQSQLNVRKIHQTIKNTFSCQTILNPENFFDQSLINDALFVEYHKNNYLKQKMKEKEYLMMSREELLVKKIDVQWKRLTQIRKAVLGLHSQIQNSEFIGIKKQVFGYLSQLIPISQSAIGSCVRHGQSLIL